jgi:hypothetical protein
MNCIIAGFSSVWNALYCNATSLLQDLTEYAVKPAEVAALDTQPGPAKPDF